MIFIDRSHAGQLLADKLSSYRGSGAVVLGLARGGVVVASEIAKRLNLPLDVLVVKKVGSPGNPEFALGAVAPDGVTWIDWKAAGLAGADEAYIRTRISRLNDEIKKLTYTLRKGKKPLKVLNHTIIIVDDGAATGATIQAAIAWCHKRNVKKLILALPVAPPEFVSRVSHDVDKLVVLHTPANLTAVGQWYKDFSQVETADVVELLHP